MKEETVKKIGELNGPWAFLFKVIQAILLPWAAWVSMVLYANNARLASVEKMVTAPADIAVMEQRVESSEKRIAILETEIKIGRTERLVFQGQVLASFAELKAKLEAISGEITKHIAKEELRK